MKKETAFIRFAENMFRAYLEERDFAAFANMICDDVSWYGVGEKELCRNKAEAITLLEVERQSWDGRFKIIEQKYRALLIEGGCCIVYGALRIKEAGFSAILLEVDSRVSLICKKDELTGRIKLLHAHISVPAPERKSDTFVAEVMAGSYSDMLKKALDERTRSLNTTMQEMSALVSNIRGGVQICAFGNEMHNIYTNDGYYGLCGFSRKEFAERFHDNHLELIHPDYRDDVITAIKKQTAIGSDFVLEYPILHKSGEVVWVIDKGSVLVDENEVKRFQRVLTDVTDMRGALAETNSLKNYYHDILNSLPTPLIIKNRENIISFINHAAINAMELKCSADAIVGKECSSLQLNICGTPACPQEMLRRGNNITHFSTNSREYSITTVPLVAKGENVGSVAVMQDETIQLMNRKMLIKKNEELMVADVRYKLAMEQVNIYMFDYFVAEKRIVMSDSAIAKFGGLKTFEDVPNGLLRELKLSKQLEQLVRETFQKISDGDPVVCVTLPISDKLGVETIQQMTMTTVYSDMGEPIRSIGIIMDVTELGKLETQRQYREAINADSFLTYEVNLTRDKIIEYNSSWAAANPNIFEMPASKIIQAAARKLVFVDDRKRFAKFCSPASMLSNFKKGISTAKLEYRRLNNEGELIWAESTFTIIRDKSSGDVKMLCQVKDITERKEHELRAQDEQMYYEAMIANTSKVYEINVTKNCFTTGHENWIEVFGIKEASYSEMIEEFADKIVHPSDKEAFLSGFKYENVLALHAKGLKEINCEYRRPKFLNGDYGWVGSTMQFIDDPATGEIRAFSRVSDINERKLWELDLLYSSQRDYISGMLNKGTTQRMIEDYIISEEGSKESHAFIMFDIDNFKDINDNFGHLFGDAVLSEVSHKATSIFRENDMLGRIGGDEFGILMKNISNSKLALDKANELCRAVHETYSTNEQKYTVSISVGIAIFPKDGVTYEELYSNADSALYNSKKAGKNAVTLFDKKTMNNVSGNTSARARVRNIESMSVERNMGEYVFRILHEASDKIAAISSVLELVSKHYDFEHAYIYEDNLDGNTATNTFRWCVDSGFAFADTAELLDYRTLGEYKSRYDRFGVLLVENVATLKGPSADIAKEQNICSFVQFAMMKNNKFVGFIGFDECDGARVYTAEEINDIKNIADVISVFLFDLRATQERIRQDNISNIMLNRLHCYAFIVDTDTYCVRYANSVAQEQIGRELDVPCYKQFYALDEPCADCMMSDMRSRKIHERTELVTGIDSKPYEVISIPTDWGEGNCILVMATERD